MAVQLLPCGFNLYLPSDEGLCAVLCVPVLVLGSDLSYWVVCSLLLNSKSSWYILSGGPLSDSWFETFSDSWGLLTIFEICSYNVFLIHVIYLFVYFPSFLMCFVLLFPDTGLFHWSIGFF